MLASAMTAMACSLAVDTSGLTNVASPGADRDDAARSDSGGYFADTGATPSSNQDAALADASSDAQADAPQCAPLNGACDTLSCCDGLRCFSSACVSCLPNQASCSNDSDCCSGHCHLLGHSCG